MRTKIISEYKRLIITASSDELIFFNDKIRGSVVTPYGYVSVSQWEKKLFLSFIHNSFNHTITFILSGEPTLKGVARMAHSFAKKIVRTKIVHFATPKVPWYKKIFNLGLSDEELQEVFDDYKKNPPMIEFDQRFSP